LKRLSATARGLLIFTKSISNWFTHMSRGALANLPRFKWTGAPFASWLFRIGSNLIADRAKRKAKTAATSEEIELIPQDSRKDSQSGLEDVERQAQLFRLVNGLPEDQRRVVALRFAEDKSIKEISNELGRSEGAVKQLQFRALQNLRAKLADER
jgi:RNA polymerase sigma-70 factor (ECF subfamily)